MPSAILKPRPKPTILAKPKIVRPERATIDFETRSACDLPRRGPWLYSKHPTTQILSLAYHLPGMDLDATKCWHRAHPEFGIEESAPPEDLFEYIARGGLVEAHNAGFEICIWNHVATDQHAWPDVAFEQWRCSAAKAAACALPRGLEEAGAALNLPVTKDASGKALLRKLSQPKRLTKAERAIYGDDAVIFLEDPDLLYELWQYNKQDVRAEVRLSDAIPDLSPMETKIWQITQRMNMRGVMIDTELARSALALAAKAKAKLNEELESITGVDAGTKRAAVKQWLEDEELLELADTKAATIEWYLDRYDRERDKLTPRARRVMEIVKEVNRTSTNKFKRMLENVDTDERARDNIRYCGAERTGRFAGQGVQIHNLPKGKFAKWLPKKNAIEIACDDVKTRNLEWCELMHGDVMNLITSCLRGSIVAPPGRDLMTADYAAIEARCVLWEAGAIKALEVFEGGGDIYCDMASGIYGYTIVKDEEALAKLRERNPKAAAKASVAKVINAMGSTQRDFGKVAVLGLGYGMGFLKFLITLRTYNIYLTRDEVIQMMGLARFKKYEAIVWKKLWPRREDYKDDKRFKAAEREASLNRRKLADEREDPAAVVHELALCKYTVDTYRARYSEVPAMWKAQEEAAIRAMRTGKAVKCGPVVWKHIGRFLKCRLPSGRTLNYCDPELKWAKTSWGEKRPALRFMSRNQKTKRWGREATYGGKLTENITQAIARDVMAFAKIKIDEECPEYELLISVHDELVAEVDEGQGDGGEFERLMSDMPACMAGCPITAEHKRYKRYRK